MADVWRSIQEGVTQQQLLELARQLRTAQETKSRAGLTPEQHMAAEAAGHAMRWAREMEHAAGEGRGRGVFVCATHCCVPI